MSTEKIASLTAALADNRVARGIDLLDRKARGWRSRIDVTRIDVFSLRDCPLAQLYGAGDPFGGYSTGIRALFGIDYTDENAVSHGFEQDEHNTYSDLTNAWHRALL